MRNALSAVSACRIFLGQSILSHLLLSNICEDVTSPYSLDAGSGQSGEAAIPYRLDAGSGQRSLQSGRGSRDRETEVRNCSLLKQRFPRRWTTVLMRFLLTGPLT